MNGRLYDPVLGRMLSPDNYIQADGLAQNYNRYSYVLNNPLLYSDFHADNLRSIKYYHSGKVVMKFRIGSYKLSSVNNRWTFYSLQGIIQ